MQKSYCYTVGVRVRVDVSVHVQMLGRMLKSWNFSLCIFSCILTLLIILIKPLTTKAHDRRASGDCGTSCLFYCAPHYYGRNNFQAAIAFSFFSIITCMRCTLSVIHCLVLYTVEPVYNGPSMEKQTVAVVGRWPLYRGSQFSRPFHFFFHTKCFTFGRHFKIIQAKDCYHNISQCFGIILI